MDRRSFGRAAAALAAAWPVARALAYGDQAQKNMGPAAALRRWADIEASVGGRLGVAVLDTASGELAGHRLDEDRQCRHASASAREAGAARAGEDDPAIVEWQVADQETRQRFHRLGRA